MNNECVLLLSRPLLGSLIVNTLSRGMSICKRLAIDLACVTEAVLFEGDKLATRRANQAYCAQRRPRLSSPFPKNISLFTKPESGVGFTRLIPAKRGGSRSSRNAGWDAVDANVPKDERHVAYGEVVWSWRPDAGVKSCRQSPARRWGQESPVPRESTK